MTPFEQKFKALLASGNSEDLVYGLTCALAIGMHPEEIVKFIRENGRGHVHRSSPYPLILIDGWQIGATMTEWIAKEHKDFGHEYAYTNGYKFDFRTKKEEDG